MDVARGKLSVLQEVESGRLVASGVSDILSRCLLCGACAEVCANNVQSDILIQYGRQQDCFKRKLVLPQRLIKAITSEELDRHILIKGGALLEKLLCRHVPESSGLHLRFPLSFFTQRSIIPQIASTSFLEGCHSENKKASGNIRVGFFVGCGTNYLFPDIGSAVLEILREAGISPFIPEQQGCCGLMAYTTGDQKRAVALAKHTIDLFSDQELDYIVTTCAGCGAQLKAFPELFNTETERRQAERFSEKVIDATSFLIDVVEYERLAESSGLKPQGNKEMSCPLLQGGSTPQKKSEDSPIRVVYHDPCHLRIKQKVMEAPRRFLRTIPGIELTELSTPQQCCGHGGTFNLSNFSLSMGILDREMSEIEQVRPDKIVTGCTGCLLQFQEGVQRIKTEKRIEVLHPLVLWKQQCLW
jgi:glycolate oxidase iron-sulfur subunit